METYLLRQPILDDKKNTHGYEVLWRDTSGGDSKDSAAANAIESFLVELSNQKFHDDKITFITFTPNLLLKNIPKIFSSELLVIQIDDSVLVHPLAKSVIYRYKKQGYKIAMTGFEFAPRFFEILDVLDYIKVDFSSDNRESLQNIVNIGHSFSKRIVAYNVNSAEAFDLARELNCDFVEGAGVAERFASKIARADHMQSNFFQLMIAITKDEPDVDEISEIISRDVTLAFSLIKLVNSAYFALKNRAKSVKQALLILGIGQLKEWVYLLSFKEGGAGYFEEIIRMSFLRARFCSELTPYIPSLPVSRSEAYLMGMFSTLESLLEVPLEAAISELSLSNEVQQALLTGEGPCGTLYALVRCYENGDWKGLNVHATALDVPMNIVTQKYFECVEYVNNIWRELNNPYSEASEEEPK